MPSKVPSAARPGQLMALALEGAWRQDAGSLSFTEQDLAAVAPGLLSSGSAALAWRRIRCTPLAGTESGRSLREAYRLHTLHAAIGERVLAESVALLQADGIEPLAAKGWATARYYPEPGLRPYGDIDLFVGAERYSVAKALLTTTTDAGTAGASPPPVTIDLQRHPLELDDRSFAELYARSSVVPLHNLMVRVLGVEDQLRMSMLHLLRHEGRRPLWWCDLGAMVEARPALDWDLVFHGSPRRASWLACTLLLARDMLGINVDALPRSWRRQAIPRWLAPAVYRGWENGMRVVPSRYAASYLRDPRGLRRGLYERWPNALTATVRWGGLPRDTPRWPYQLRYVAWTLGLYGCRHAPVLRSCFARRRQQEGRDVAEWRRLLI